nr:hypothetical protein CFP56_15865 [Quercus suber]
MGDDGLCRPILDFSLRKINVAAVPRRQTSSQVRIYSNKEKIVYLVIVIVYILRWKETFQQARKSASKGNNSSKRSPIEV